MEVCVWGGGVGVQYLFQPTLSGTAPDSICDIYISPASSITKHCVKIFIKLNKQFISCSNIQTKHLKIDNFQ